MNTAEREVSPSGWSPLWNPVRFSVFCLVICPGSILGSEIEEFIGQPVVRVELLSDGLPLPDDGAQELVETKVGAPLSMREVRESITHLFSLGRFESVEVTGVLLSDGVALQYGLVPQQFIEQIDLAGETGMSTGDLRRAITEAHGSSFRADEAVVVADTLRKLYRERGFLLAQVETRVDVQGADPVLRIKVNAGDRAVVDRIVVRGVSPTMYQRVLSRLGLEAGRLYDGVEIERRLREYESELRRYGYYEVSLSHDIEEVTGGSHVHLILGVQHGRRITVEFAGEDVPGADLASLVTIEQEGSVDEDLLEDVDRRISEFLHGRGYRNAFVTHSRVIDRDELSIIFTVNRGRLYEIDQLLFSGNATVPDSVLTPLLNSAPGVPLVMRELDTELDLVAEHYRQLGYATVRVERHVEELSAETDDLNELVPVVCTIEIDEGARTVVRSVMVEGNEFQTDVEIASIIKSLVGSPYYSRRVVVDRDSIHRVYLNAGFERAVVTVEPKFDENLEAVDLVYRVSEGPQTLIEHVLIVGNEQIESTTIRRELVLAEGEPLGLSAVAETRRRLNALGLFRRIDLREFSHGGGNRRDVVIVVEEAAATRLGYGGGLEFSQRLRRETNAFTGVSQAVEQIEFAPRGFVQIGRRNLWGKNRSIDLFTRVSVRRKNDRIDLIAADQVRNFGFNEYRILGTYAEPRTFGLTWDTFVTGFIEEAIRPGFDLFSRGVNAEIRQELTPTLSTSVAYGWGKNDTSNIQLNAEDVPLVDRLFEKVRLSSFSGSLVRDTRDDVVDPASGEVVSVDAKVAGRAIGSEVGFAKTFMQAFIYRILPGTRRVIVAAGARLGLSVGFPRFDLETPLTPIELVENGQSLAAVPANRQRPLLPISERFFTGGDATVRGYAFDRLGIAAGLPGATIDEGGFPQGGNAVVILNGELRVPVTQNLGVVGFLDAGNVYDRVSNISLGQIRGGVGFGVRYRSPVGPIRVDLGFKLDRQEFGSGPNLTKEQLTAIHISIGQAF